MDRICPLCERSTNVCTLIVPSHTTPTLIDCCIATCVVVSTVMKTDPQMLPQVQVDAGAIRFILDGANIMCRGLTSKGAKMETELKANTHVAIMVEGKQHAIGVGKMRLSTADMYVGGVVGCWCYPLTDITSCVCLVCDVCDDDVQS